MKAKLKLATCGALLATVGIAFQNCGSPDGDASSGSGNFSSEIPANPAAANFSKNKCSFTLAGAGNAVWSVERYVDYTSDCAAEELIVRSNNPNATIRSVNKNYVFDDVTSADKLKCTYTLQRSGGAPWISERYIAATGDCNGTELNVVRTNNPLANVVKVQASYVHDDVTAIEKTKCTFELRGASGSAWAVERYTSATNNCDGERAIVAANNPRATITKVAANFVHDPF